jgi:hypothetical protein
MIVAQQLLGQQLKDLESPGSGRLKDNAWFFYSLQSSASRTSSRVTANPSDESLG